VHGVSLLLAVASICAAQQASDFAGTWVLRQDGQNVLKLTLANDHGILTGSLTRPKTMSLDGDGTVTSIGPDQANFLVQKSSLMPRQVELTIDGDRYVMSLVDRGRASLDLDKDGMRPLKLERASDGSAVILANKLLEPDYPAEIRTLRERLAAMVKADQDARLAFDEARMEVEDAKSRPEVLQIFGKYGWVTKSLAGKDAAHSFWLLVQHQTPEIQRRLLPALEKAAKSGDASMSDYALLYDRVQVGLGKPQRWGSQAKCQSGKPVLDPVEDPAGLDARRKELFMQPIIEYLKLDSIAKYCAQAGK
jgi:hypothetical protein